MKLRGTIPVLHVSSSEQAEAFYTDKLGFRRHSAYRQDESLADPCYLSLVRDGAWLHLSSFAEDSVAGCAVYVLVDDVDALHREMLAKGVVSDFDPTDQTWGNREFYVEDPDGNSVRFVQESGPQPESESDG